MNRFEKKSLIILTASILCAVISAVCRIILTDTLLDPVFGVYAHGTPIPQIYHAALAIVTAALIAAAYFTAPSRDSEYDIPESGFSIFTSFAAMLLLVFAVFFSLFNIYKTATESMSPSALDLFEIVFLLPSAFYFFGLTKKRGNRTLPLAITSLFPSAWCAVSLIKVYFDNDALMTSPNKIINELALLSAMLYFLSEARVQLGTVLHKFYLAAAAAAPILLLTSALPNLFMADKLALGKSDSNMLYAIEAVFALFMWARLGAYAKRTDISENTVGIMENSNS